jgi:hypothetical protein
MLDNSTQNGKAELRAAPIIQITNKFAGGKQLLDDEVILIIRTI